ncbi:MAG: hypothetical protein ACRDQU_21230 [Pseudonocardiaceae bacterium]
MKRPIPLLPVASGERRAARHCPSVTCVQHLANHIGALAFRGLTRKSSRAGCTVAS